MLELASLLGEFFSTDACPSPPTSFEALCDRLPFTVARVRDGVVDWINDAGWQHDGAARQEDVIGARVSERWPAADWESRHRRVLVSGTPESFVTPVQTASGRRVWVCNTMFRSGPDTVLVIADDITNMMQNLMRATLSQASSLGGNGTHALPSARNL